MKKKLYKIFQTLQKKIGRFFWKAENTTLNIEVEKNENSGVTRRKFEIIEWYLRSTQGSRPHVIYASLRVSRKIL